jgi:DNA-binding NarL/FixJ family response regulator
VIRVFIVDDQALVRGGFRMLIEAEDDLEVAGEAADGMAALERLAALPTDAVDVILMDIRMPGWTASRPPPNSPARTIRRGSWCSPRSTSTSTSTLP